MVQLRLDQVMLASTHVLSRAVCVTPHGLDIAPRDELGLGLEGGPGKEASGQAVRKNLEVRQQG